MTKNNNFDILRLLAAFQVAFTHTCNHLDYSPGFLKVISYFPGVPIFFFISGFLIAGSYKNTGSTMKVFFQNRFLRLFPALWVCFCVSFFLVLISGYHIKASITDVLVWIVANNSILQFYNPTFMREYGVGVLNGSLWTISVELQFYILTPLVCLLLSGHKKVFLGVFLILICANVTNTLIDDRNQIFEKVLYVSFMPWLYMFVVGAFLRYQEALVRKILSFNVLYFLFIYLLSRFFAESSNIGVGNSINPISFILLACLTIKLAYSFPELSDKILNKNDLSYGIYIYHMPVINFLFYIDAQHEIAWLLVAVLTLSFAFISGFTVELPALQLKTKTVKRR